MHSAIDAHSRLAYSEILANEQGPTCAGFFERADGKVERFNRTLLDEWAYVRLYTSNSQRTRALDRYLHLYNHHRGHTALGGDPPITHATPRGTTQLEANFSSNPIE